MAHNGGARVNLVGLCIQYEELTARDLPSIDLERFHREAPRLNPSFADDLRDVKLHFTRANIAHPTAYLESTRDLVSAFSPILEYDLGLLLRFSLPWTPTKGWDLDSVLSWL
jgi:hypothetical protein